MRHFATDDSSDCPVMLDFSIIKGIALAGLVAFLYLRRSRSRRAVEEQRRAQERRWVGHGFDASTIAPQIQTVRQAHLGSIHFQPSRARHQKKLLAAAGRLVATLSYFRHVPPVSAPSSATERPAAP
jgi:hypothetical protein